MVKKANNNKRRVNNSISPLTKSVNEQVNRVMHNLGGTVTYFFETERIIFNPSNPKGKVITISSVLQSSINPECFFRDNGNRVSPVELHNIFSTTAHDLGATRFELD